MLVNKSGSPVNVNGANRKRRARSPYVQLLYALVGERVRQRREELGFTQEELASAVGAARTSITNLEKGRQYAQLDLLADIAKHLEMSLAELMPTPAELTPRRRHLQLIDELKRDASTSERNADA